MPKKYQLKNGTRVLLYPRRRAPVVSIQVWVGTGSADERRGEEGISHFIEHLLFKGSKDFAVGEMAKTIESHGGQINAYTTFDQTVFYCTLSSEFIDKGIHVLSDMVGYPKFDKIEIDREREVVIEEIKRSLDNPRQVASRELFSVSYGKHPYGTPIIGFEENIKNVTPEEIRDYYAERYIPKNMTVLVVGDFDEKEIKSKIQSAFGTLPGSRLKPRKRARRPVAKNIRVRAKQGTFSEAQVYLAWPAPKTKHKDVVALSLLGMTLGYGESSRLVRRLRNQEHIVNAVGASLFTAKDEGMFIVSATMSEDKIQDFLKITGEEIVNLLKNGISDGELARIKNLVESDRFYSLETVDGLAALVGHYEYFYGDHKVFEAQIKETSRTKPQRLKLLGKKYLNLGKLDVVCLSRQDEAAMRSLISKEVRNWRKIRASAAAKSTRSAKIPSLKMKLKKASKNHAAKVVSLSGGSKMVIKRVEGSAVAAIRLGWLGGAGTEPQYRLGLNELFGRVWGTATLKRSEHEVSEFVESRAGSLSAFAGKNTLGMSAACLLPLTKDFSDLLKEMIVEPEFDRAIMDRELRLMNEYAKHRVDKPMQKCMLHLNKIIFSGHFYGQDPYQNLSALNDLGTEELRNHLKQHLGRPMVISLVGDLTKEQINEFKKIAERRVAGSRQEEVVRPETLASLNEPAYHFEKSEKQQSHLAIAFRGLNFGDERRPVLDCLQAVLAGQGGRLFIELRDKASLAYSVAPIRMDGYEGGYFGAYIGCSPEKAATAVKMMRAEFQKLMDAPVSEEELGRARRYLIGKYDISLQKNGFIADELFFDEIYGLKLEEAEDYKSRLRAVTVSDIRQLSEDIFTRNPALSVVGPSDVLI